MSPMLPISIAGFAMAYIGAPPWVWLLILLAAVLRTLLADMLDR